MDGSLAYPSLEDSIRESIKVILLTRPGEQLMRPEYGAGLNRFLHEPNTLVTRRRIRDAVQTSLQRWEPRIVLQRVDVWENERQADSLRVEIVYQVRRTAQVETMSLTMNLES
jgi:phage baseplate assembly protein W